MATLKALVMILIVAIFGLMVTALVNNGVEIERLKAENVKLEAQVRYRTLPIGRYYQFQGEDGKELYIVDVTSRISSSQVFELKTIEDRGVAYIVTVPQ